MGPIAPAFPNEDAFFCRFFTDVGSYLDAANRRLHEVDFRAEEEDGAYVKCPFRDSRRGFLMNKAALTQITSEWSEVLRGIEFLSSLYAAEAPEARTLGRAWRICMSSMFAPLYLYKRGASPVDNGKLPTPVSGVFKIMLDVPTTLDLMVLAKHKQGILESCDPLLSQDVQEFADKNLILLNGAYACAGAPGLIDNVVGILFQNRAPEQAGKFSDLFANRQEFKDFNYYMSCQYVVGTLYLLTTMVTMEKAFTESQKQGRFSGAEQEVEPLSAYERRRRIALATLATPDDRDAALTAFASLVKNPFEWDVGGCASFDVGAALRASLEFLRETDSNGAADLVGRYERYQTFIEGQLSQVQEWAECSIGASAMFPRPVRFATPQRHPVEILRNAR